MNDQLLTHEQLLKDNARLRRRAAELEKSEEAMRSSEKRCKQLVENAADIIFQCDRQGRFVYVNPVSIRIMGYSRKELLCRNYLDLIRPDLRRDAETFYGRQFVKKIKNTYHEYPVVSKQGNEIWIGQNVQIILEADVVTGFQAIARDITELRKAREALRESESRYRYLFENSPDIVYYLNSEAKFVAVNNNTVHTLGYPNEEVLLGQYVTEVVHPEDRDRVMASFNDAVATKRKHTRSLIFRLMKNDGEILWVELRSRMNFDEDGTFLEEVGFLRDITERKQMNERLIRLNLELEETNKNLQSAYQWMRDSRDRLKKNRYEEDIGFLVDRDGRIEWISETALLFSGKSRLALIGGNLPELLHDDCREEFYRAMHQAWMGITIPFSTLFALNGSAGVIMDVKMTRLTSHKTRRLWVLFQHPPEKAGKTAKT